ncbi:MAG: hypothetical protein H0X11_14360, partial [Betaproteobacteria bacterium]|nr:hypothetical protein [Betaproteobacteria bacterium]
RSTLAKFDDVLGLGLADWRPHVEEVPEQIRALAESRAEARKKRQWAEADRLRAELAGNGWEMEDRSDGYLLKKTMLRSGGKPGGERG